MSIQLGIVIICIVVALVFMVKKVMRTLRGGAACECSTCGGEKACQKCHINQLRNLNDEKGHNS